MRNYHGVKLYDENKEDLDVTVAKILEQRKIEEAEAAAAEQEEEAEGASESDASTTVTIS